MTAPLRAPFPWFGGKFRVAPLVWQRFGDVRNYVEPFAGSLAVLLARPHAPGTETVNDKDAYVANFWRAVAADPDAVAHYADWPVNEADLHARHRWLVDTGTERLVRLTTDPDSYDAQVAGWWVWGLCLWIGTGWCQHPEWRGRGHAANAGGIHTVRPPRQRPALNNEGMGVHRNGLPHQTPRLTGAQGVHAAALAQQVPFLGHAGKGSDTLAGKLPHLADPGQGVDALSRQDSGIPGVMRALAARLRRVRVCVGDWSRVCTPAVTSRLGVTGVLLDPPYHGVGADRDVVYNHDEGNTVWAAAKEWAVANGDDPMLRIALCGYEGDHGIPDTWSAVAWQASGGYARTERSRANRGRERIWFSPYCLGAEQQALSLEEVR